eukprot:EG_transcript_30103
MRKVVWSGHASPSVIFRHGSSPLVDRQSTKSLKHLSGDRPGCLMSGLFHFLGWNPHSVRFPQGPSRSGDCGFAHNKQQPKHRSGVVVAFSPGSLMPCWQLGDV